MKELDRYMKHCNLVFTDTLSRSDFCQVGFNPDKVEVNYNDSITLLHLISSFNELYLLFQKEYEKLEKLDLGKRVEVLGFHQCTLDQNHYRFLILYINHPVITKHEDTILYLREMNDDIKPFVTNNINRNPDDKNYYCEDIQLNSEIAQKYLDLFEKYSSLITLYHELKNASIFGDGTNYIFTSIDHCESNLLDGLSNFKISFGSSYFNTEYFVDLSIRLGNDFGIDYDNCRLVLKNEKVSTDINSYHQILNNVYIHKKYVKKIVS